MFLDFKSKSPIEGRGASQSERESDECHGGVSQQMF